MLAKDFFNEYIESHLLGERGRDNFIYELAGKMGLILDGRPIYIIVVWSSDGKQTKWKEYATFETLEKITVNQLMSKGFGSWSGFEFLGFEEREIENTKPKRFWSEFLDILEKGYEESERTNF